MHTLETPSAAGFKPEPLSSRIFIRCYRHYAEAKRAYDQLRVVARIPDRQVTVVARDLEWRESLPTGSLLRYATAAGAALGGIVALLLWSLGFTGSDTGWLAQLLVGVVAGLASGALVASAVAWVRSRRPELAETGHVAPGHYDILVEEKFAPAAREVLDVD